MKKIVGIRFKPAGKVYHFDSGAFVLKKDDHVIVETERGLGFGKVVVPPTPPEALDTKASKRPLKKVFRLASKKDFMQIRRNQQTESLAHAFCQQCIDNLKLKMNLFDVESTFDGGKLTFYFTSDGRIDFRQLVKMLVKELGVRIEMRQVGIRNQAKMCGGIGRCGRELCCTTFMEKFGPVSIRMAKEQGLSLNPTKISGQCGRLMCCLTFENETYQSIKKKLPKIGRNIETAQGKGKVIRHNVLCGRFVIRLEGGNEMEMTPNDIIKGKKAAS